MTRMTRIISVLFALFSSATLLANDTSSTSAPLELAPDAPQKHVVVRGDTLWGISALFLKDPFRWSELWNLNNDQIKKPHWIYPGQVLVLDTSNGQPSLSIEGGGIPTVKVKPELRITEESQAIPAIPQQAIEPFLSQPLVAEEGALDIAPRIVAIQHDRVVAAENDVIYVTKIAAGSPRQWQIYRPGNAIKDPRTDETLGYEAVLLGSAKLVKEG